MKKAMLVCAVILLFAGVASAQNVKPFDVYVGGGLGIPTGPDGFKDSWKNGINLSAGIGYNVAPMISLIGHIDYHSFPYNIPSEYSGDYDGWRYSAVLFGADLGLSPNLPAFPLKPFLRAGVGMAYTKISDLEVLGETFLEGDSETRPYFSFGGGFEFPMGPAMKLFVEGRMNMIMYSDAESSISDETVSFMPITVGIKF